jgi:hypothetical protein
MEDIFDFDELDLDVGPIISYEEREFSEIRGGKSAANLSGGNFRIKMQDMDAISLPSDSYLKVRYTIRSAATVDSAVLTTGQISPVNGAMNLFRKAQYVLNNKIIEDIDQPGSIQVVKGLIEYSEDYERGSGIREFWYPDRGTDSHAIYVRNVTQNAIPGVTIPDRLLVGDAAVNHVVLPDSIVGYFNNDALQFIVDGDVMELQFGDIPQPPNLTYTDTGVNSIDYAGFALTNTIIGYTWRGKFYPNEIVSSNTDAIFDVLGAGLVIADGVAVALTSVLSASGSNTGEIKRRDRCTLDDGSTGLCVEARIPLSHIFGFLKDNPKVVKGLSQELRLDIADNADMLFRTSATSAGFVQLEELTWWVPILKVSPPMQQHLDSFLTANNPRNYQWSQAQHYRSQEYAIGSTTGVWLLEASNAKPEKLYIYFQNSARLSDQTQNNMVFDNMGVSRIFARINSNVQYPEDDYELDFTESTTMDYMRAYSAYLTECGGLVESGVCKPNVSFEEFKTLYTIFVFDMQYQDDRIFSNTTQYNITLHWYLSTGSATAFNINAVLMSKRQLQITGIAGRMTLM